MFPTNTIAFKEWASIVEVLGRGDQILILRKGGIHEERKKFEVAHEEFFLFPTFEHQNPKDLKPKGAEILESVLREKPAPGDVPIHYYCVVENSFWISDEDILKQLEPFHLWSWECVKARYDWGEKRGLFGILIRTYSLPSMITLENLKRYGGCRSWVELEQPLQTHFLKPVLSDKIFQEKKEKLNYLLNLNSSPVHKL